MAVSITQTDLTRPSSEMPKKHSVYDNFDNLKSVVHYNANQEVDYILKGTVNDSGKFLDTKKYVQVEVDVVQAPTNISFDSATLRARVYKNEGSKVYETGFIYWTGPINEPILDKIQYGDALATPSIFKGNFSKSIFNLLDDTTYNYRAYVKHEYGINFSKVYQFNTISFSSVFSIAGDKFSGPAPLTVNLSAINAGTEGYTYGWNMTGGPISFLYSVSGITITSSGSGYEPELPRYILETIQITSSGAGYNPAAETLVLVNNTVNPLLTASFGFDVGLAVFRISAVQIPYPLSGYTNNTFVVTFSSSDSSSITETASGIGAGGSYTIPRQFEVFIDNITQPSLSVLNVYNEELDTFQISAIDVPSEIFGFTNSSRTVSISTTDPVPAPATAVATGNIQIIADYNTKNITHTFSAAGTYLTKAYAIIGDQIEKEASRTIRANQATNFTSEWSSVINSSFGNDVVAAYDFRNLAGGIDARGLNEKCIAFYDFSYEQADLNRSGLGSFGSSAYGRFQPNKLVGGYIGNILYRGQNSFPTGGYSVQNGIGGYWGGIGNGILGGYAAKFTSEIGGYGSQNNQRFNSTEPWAFLPNGELSVSLWVNYPQFWDEPGSKIFSFFNSPFNKEFGVTQSTTRLCILKSLEYAEDNGDRTTGGYNGAFGWPIMTTTDPSKMLVAGQWNHMVITRDGGNNYKYYLNGQLALSAQNNDFLATSNQLGGYLGGYGNFSIGSSVLRSTYIGAPSGLIDAVGIWNKVLEQKEIDVLYNSGEGFEDVGVITPIVGPKLHLAGIGSNINTIFITEGDPYWDKTTLLLQFSGSNGSENFIDSSLNGVVLSAAPLLATISTDQFKFNTSSGRFGGLSATGVPVGGGYMTIAGYITTPAGDDYMAFGRNDFTIEWWEYFSENLGGYRGIFTYGNPDISFDNGYGVEITRPHPQLAMRYYDGNENNAVELYFGGYPTGFNVAGGYTATFNEPPLEYNTWTHRALVREGNAFNFYRNGILTGTTGSYFWMAGYSPNIGSENLGGYVSINDVINNTLLAGYGSGVGMIGAVYSVIGLQALSGYLDDFRVTKGIARYKQNFTPPTTQSLTFGGNFLYGTQFEPGEGGSFGASKTTINITQPHTLVFIGNVNTNGSNAVYQTASPIINPSWSADRSQRLGIWSNPSQGLRPFASQDNWVYSGATTGGNIGGYNYYNGGNEYFYAAYSFLPNPFGNNEIRYHLQTPSFSAEGLAGGYSRGNFGGYVGFGQGLGGYNLTDYNINGIARLGVFINRAFSTHEEMLTLFNAITSGPASNVTLI